MPREPTAEEKARMEKGPRYDPSRPRAPWGQRGGDGGGERVPPPGWEERGLQKGWPSPEPIPPPPPMDYDWALPGLGFWKRGLEKGWPPLPPEQTPVILEPGMEAWPKGMLPPWFERGGGLPPSGKATAWGLEPVVPWPERGARPSGAELALEGNINRWRQEYSAETPITLPEGYLDFDYEERLNQYDQQLRDLQAQYEAKKSEVSDLAIEENQKASALAQLAQWYAQSQAAIAQAKAEVEAKIPELQNLQWERHDWLLSQAYDKVIFDPETGRQLSWNEVERLARTNPYMPIVEVLALGGGDTLETDTTIADLVATYTPEGLEALAAEEALGIKTKAEEQLEEKFSEKEAKVLDEGIPDLVSQLDAKVSPEELQNAKMNLKIELYNLYLENPEFVDGYPPGENPWNRAERKINEALREQGRFQDFAGEAGKKEPPEAVPASQLGKVYGHYPEGWKGEVGAEKVDVGALGKMLAPFGINLMGNYPWISPITEAHLMRITPDVIEQMARYLSEKGLSWRDWLEISASWYGGSATPRTGYAIPRQW